MERVYNTAIPMVSGMTITVRIEIVMVTKKVHIVFGKEAERVLRRAFSKEVILCCDMDLSIGPIQGLLTSAGFEARRKWLAATGCDNALNEKQTINPFDDFFTTLTQAINRNVTLNFWIGHEPRSLTGLYLCLSVVGTVYPKTAIVDISSQVTRSLRNKYFHPKLLTEVPVSQINSMGLLTRNISSEEKERLEESWNSLIRHESYLRVINENGEVVGVNADYYDNNILAHCAGKPVVAAIIIGRMLQDVFVPDVFLDYRIREMIKEGKLDYEGSLENMRTYGIWRKS